VAKKGGKTTFGYKLHPAVDCGSQLIRDARLTSANVNDCVIGPKLVQGDETAVCADKAYDNATMRTLLKEQNIRDGIMRRPNKHHKLPRHEIARNSALGTVRGRIEGVFATLKRLYDKGRMRLLGMTRNRADLMITLTAINLRRAVLLAA
jgi:IS5 family transposase